MRRWLPLALAIVLFLLGALALTYVAVYQRYSVSHSQTRIVRLDGLTGAIAVFDQTGKRLNAAPPINVYDIIKHDVDIRIAYDTNICPSDSIAVGMNNKSEHDLLYATFKIDVRKKGRSSTLLEPKDSQKSEKLLLMPLLYKENSYSWDKVLKKDENDTFCYPLPRMANKKLKLSELDFSVYDVMFTFDGVENPFSDSDTLTRFKDYSF